MEERAVRVADAHGGDLDEELVGVGGGEGDLGEEGGRLGEGLAPGEHGFGKGGGGRHGGWSVRRSVNWSVEEKWRFELCAFVVGYVSPSTRSVCTHGDTS